MVSQLAQFYPLALCVPFVWVIFAYGRGAYVFPVARRACLIIGLLAVLSCCVIYIGYIMYLSAGRFPSFTVFSLFVIAQLLMKYAKLPGVLHRDILFLQSPISMQESTILKSRSPIGLGRLLFVGIIVISGVLFVGGMFLAPCARLDTLLNVSGCQGGIELGDYQLDDSSFSFAPNSQHVAVFPHHKTVAVGDVLTREILWSVNVNAKVTAYTWSSNSVTLAVSTDDGRVLVYDVASGILKSQMLYGESETMALSFVNHTPMVVVLGDKQHASVWDSNTGKIVTSLSVPSVFPGNVVSSPDGQWIAIAFAGNVYLYDTATWERQESSLPGSSIGAWSPDARKIITYEGEKVIRHTQLSTGGWQSETIPYNHPLRDVFFSSDSHLFFVYASFSYQLQGDKVEIWDVEKNEVVFEYNRPHISLEQIRVSPDSETIGILETRHWRELVLELWTSDLK